MGDADALLRAVLESPADDVPRLVYADWLEEHGGWVDCPHCAYDGERQWGQKCVTCQGTHRLSDGWRERAEFIRVQCELAFYGPNPDCRFCDGHRGYVETDRTTTPPTVIPTPCVRCWKPPRQRRPLALPTRRSRELLAALVPRLAAKVLPPVAIPKKYDPPCSLTAAGDGLVLGRNPVPEALSFAPATHSITFTFRRGFAERVECALADFERYAAAIFRRHPVTEVRLTDRRPSWNGRAYCWYRDDRDRPSSATPATVKSRLRFSASPG